MKYNKNQYSDGSSICAVIIAVGLIYGGITWFYMWYISIFLIVGGLSIIISQVRAIANRGNLRRAVKFEYESNPDATIEGISKSLGITQKDVQAITLDLKVRGELRGIFSTTTGTLEVVPASAPDDEKSKFCPHCGTPIREGSALFCAYCGAPFQEKAIAN